MDKLTFNGHLDGCNQHLDAQAGEWRYSVNVIIEDFTDYQAVRQMKEGGYRVAVEMKRWRRHRTNAQNAIFHALVRLIAVESHQDFDLVKEGLKQAYAPHEKDAKGRLIPMPTSGMSTVEMAPLITGTLTEAWELGINTREQEREWSDLLNHPAESEEKDQKQTERLS